MASESKFHDEALCQLLHAAQDDRIGEAARQAVRSAAKARVVQLAKMKERGEVRSWLGSVINESLQWFRIPAAASWSHVAGFQGTGQSFKDLGGSTASRGAGKPFVQASRCRALSNTT
jgi:hypothetical protein